MLGISQKPSLTHSPRPLRRRRFLHLTLNGMQQGRSRQMRETTTLITIDPHLQLFPSQKLPTYLLKRTPSVRTGSCFNRRHLTPSLPGICTMSSLQSQRRRTCPSQFSPGNRSVRGPEQAVCLWKTLHLRHHQLLSQKSPRFLGLYLTCRAPRPIRLLPLDRRPW